MSKGGYRVHGRGGEGFVLKEASVCLWCPRSLKTREERLAEPSPYTLSHTARASLLLLQTRSLPFTLPLAPAPFLPLETELLVPALPSLIPSLSFSPLTDAHM